MPWNRSVSAFCCRTMTCLSVSEPWPVLVSLSIKQKKNMESAHHRFPWQTLGEWRMKSKTRTSGSKQKFSVKERKLRRLGHSLHMHVIDSRLTKHTVYREVNSIEQKPGRWKIKIELDIWHYILGSEGNYSDLGRRATVFCQQRRLAIECSRMCLQTRELNYGLRTKIYWSEWTHTHILMQHKYCPLTEKNTASLT